MTPTLAIDSLHAARIALSLRQLDDAMARGDIDAACDHLVIAIRRHHARVADRDTPDNPARVSPPDHLTDDGYADDVARWDEDREPTGEDDA